MGYKYAAKRDETGNVRGHVAASGVVAQQRQPVKAEKKNVLPQWLTAAPATTPPATQQSVHTARQSAHAARAKHASATCLSAGWRAQPGKAPHTPHSHDTSATYPSPSRFSRTKSSGLRLVSSDCRDTDTTTRDTVSSQLAAHSGVTHAMHDGNTTHRLHGCRELQTMVRARRVHLRLSLMLSALTVDRCPSRTALRDTA